MVELSSPQPPSVAKAGAAAMPASATPLEARKERREAQVEQLVLLMS
jgi:hypothetical protein